MGPVPAWLKLGSWLLPPLLAACLAYPLGLRHGAEGWRARLAEQRAADQGRQAAEAERAQRQLQAALQQQQRLRELLGRQEARLLSQQRDLQQRLQDQKQRIEYVVQQDGGRYGGLGPDSLRLYRQVLGYSTASMSATDSVSIANPNQAAAAGAGLPAADLLAHAADYGAWCQQLEQRLTALGGLFTSEGPQP
ncbi:MULTISPECIES: hypothetical protein [Chromobacterium]|uniref:hypothetical protein n=1 Tax=Chromobacterium TaxID=535 RepID=UPI001886F688|nr:MULTISPECIES: hypothetical protein [Chromobacterium]QOZ82250.1 hypothetical protein DXT74_03725 [Chromobacterium sp. Rain0013]WON82284.1 hypothetical protein OK026_14095 [Chromobacterium haemolyticum]